MLRLFSSELYVYRREVLVDVLFVNSSVVIISNLTTALAGD